MCRISFPNNTFEEGSTEEIIMLFTKWIKLDKHYDSVIRIEKENFFISFCVVSDLNCVILRSPKNKSEDSMITSNLDSSCNHESKHKNNAMYSFSYVSSNIINLSQGIEEIIRIIEGKESKLTWHSY